MRKSYLEPRFRVTLLEFRHDVSYENIKTRTEFDTVNWPQKGAVSCEITRNNGQGGRSRTLTVTDFNTDRKPILRLHINE